MAISHGRVAHVVTRARVLNAFVVVTGAVIASVLTVLLLLLAGL